MPVGHFLSIDTNLEDLGSRFRAVRLEMRGASSREVAEDVAQIAEDAVRKEAPEGRSGNLRDTLEGRVGLTPGFTGRGYWVASVYSPEKYTGWVIEGRGWVRPVRAQVLHWVTKSGEDVFSMYARPTKPNPFHERGWKHAEPAVRARWREYAESIGMRLRD